MTQAALILTAPTKFGELRGWLERASRRDLESWLREAPEAMGMISPIGRALAPRIALPPAPDGATVVSFRVQAEILNPWGYVHGGVLLALMDEVCSIATALHVGPRYFGATATLSASFIRPLRDDSFSIAAQIVARTLTALTARAEVRDSHGAVHDEALATFSLRSPTKAQMEPSHDH